MITKEDIVITVKGARRATSELTDLAKAERAVGKVGQQAGKGVKNLEESLDKASGGAEKATTATKRAKKPVEDLGDAGDKASGEIDKAGVSLGALARTAAAVAAPLLLARKAFRMAEVGARQLDQAQAFRHLGGNINVMNRSLTALNHTVTRSFIRQQFNMARTLGISAAGFAKLAKIAKAASTTMGIDTTYALESVVIGVARQSRLFLDNLGIIVNVDKANKEYAAGLGIAVGKLTDAQKKVAFLNATLKAGDEIIRNAPIDAYADRFKQLSADIDESTDALRQFLAVKVVGPSLDIIAGRPVRFFTLNKTRAEQAQEHAQALVKKLDAAQRELARVSRRTDRGTTGGGFMPPNRNAIEAAQSRVAAIQREILDVQRKTFDNARKFLLGAGETILEKAKATATALPAAIKAQAKAAEAAAKKEKKRHGQNLSAQRRLAAQEARDAKAALALQRRIDAELQTAEFRAMARREAVKRAEHRRDIARLKEREAAKRAEHRRDIARLKERRAEGERTALAAIASRRRRGESAGRRGIGGLFLLARPMAEAGAEMVAFRGEMSATISLAENMATTVGGAFSAMAQGIGRAATMAIIHGKSFAASVKEATAAMLESLSMQAFSQAAYLLAIAAVTPFFPALIGLAPIALEGAAALAVVGTATALAAKALGAGAGQSSPGMAAGGGGAAIGGQGFAGPAPNQQITTVVNVVVNDQVLARAVATGAARERRRGTRATPMLQGA